MQKSKAAAILAGIDPNKRPAASAPTNLHVMSGEVVETSEDGQVAIRMPGMFLGDDDEQYVEVDTLGGLEEGDTATIILAGEEGKGMSPMAIGGVGSVDRIVSRVVEAEQLIAQKADIDELEANYAHITEGVIDNAAIDQANVNGLSATYATIDNLDAATGRIGALEADTADIETIRANSAKVSNLTADQLSAATGYIGELTAGSVTAQNIIADKAKLAQVDIQQIAADHAKVGQLDTTYATIENLNAATGRITNLESTKANISDLEADYITADEIEATYMRANMSNSDVAWIENGTIKNGAIVSAMINDVSANKLTAGTINGSVINVTNLNADNITTGTINGQRIGMGSLSLNKLSEDVYTEAEVDSKLATMQAEIDGAIETWTGTEVPTLQNSPASSWNTTALKDSHVGDVYFVVNSNSQQNGYNYRFTKSGSTYSWQLIKDSDVTNALQRISAAEGKITTFDSDISTLKTDTGTLTTRTTSLETRMSDAESDILDKVDTTTFNEVSDTVDQHTQTISQHTTAISNKADSSTVTAVTNRVSKTEQDISGINTTIGELQDTVETKADGSTVSTISNKLNTVSDTVDGHTQTLTSVQNTLSTKADSSTVSTLTTKVNNVSDTVDGHTQTIAGQSTILTKNGLTSSTNITNRVSSVEQDLSGYKTTVSETYTTKQEFADLEVGGRNRLINTANPTNDKAVRGYGCNDARVNGGSLSYSDGVGTYTVGSSASIEHFIRFIPSDTNDNLMSMGLPSKGDLVFSGYVKTSTTGNGLCRLHVRGQCGSGGWRNPEFTNLLTGQKVSSADSVNIIVGAKEEWTPFAVKMSWSDFEASIFYISFQMYNAASGNTLDDSLKAGDTFQFKKLKLEKGNKATDWTPAPEDIETRMSSAETAIEQNSDQIALRATKTEATQMAQPNLSPFFSMAPTNAYNATTNPDGYWDANKASGWTLEQIADGWVHIDFSNTGTSTRWFTIYEHCAWRHRAGDLKGSTKYTVMIEFRNVTKSGNVTCIGTTANTTSWPSMFIGDSEQGNVGVADGVQYHVGTTVADPASVTGSACTTRTLITFPAGSSLDAEFRVSLYEGEYAGPYKPYSGDMMYATNSELKVTADGISTEVSKKADSATIISTIRQSAETVKIKASQVEIDGTAVFNAISSDVDSAITNKGYATTSQAQGYATTAVSNLVIGGRNLLLNTENPTSSKPPKPIGDSITWGGTSGGDLSFADGIMKFVAYGNSAEHYIRLNTPSHTQRVYESMGVDVHDSLVLSGFVRASMSASDAVVVVRAQISNGTSFLNTITLKNLRTGSESTDSSRITILNGSSSEWVRFEVSIYIPESVAAVNAYYSFQQYGTFTAGDTIEFKRLKLERGTRATDWSPAPEDVNAGILAATDEVNKAYEKIRSQGIQLVTNGNGFMGDNTNFTSFTFDGNVSNNSPGSFTRAVGSDTVFTDEMFPVDTSKEYIVEFDVMAGSLGAKMYAMLAFCDVDKKNIPVQAVSYYPGSTTTLARELKNGDTVVYLTDASGWTDTSTAHQRSLIIWDYTNSFGYTYPAETYSRNYYANNSSGMWNQGSLNKTNNTIALRTAWTGGTHAAGTPISQNSSGSNYAYFWYIVNNQTSFPTEWTRISGTYKGMASRNPTPNGGTFWPGTAYCRIGWLWNYGHTSSAPQSQIWITNVSVKEHTASSSDAVKRTQRIWYRKSAAGAPATPGTASSNWVTKADDGTNAWTKMHVAISSSAKYIYTCEQYEMADGTVGYTSVLLDNTITVIDGGSVITNTITANQVNFADATGSQLKLFDPSNPTNYQVISGSGNEVFVGGESAASFGETTRIGRDDETHVSIDSDSMDVTNGDNEVIASIGKVYVDGHYQPSVVLGEQDAALYSYRYDSGDGLYGTDATLHSSRYVGDVDEGTDACDEMHVYSSVWDPDSNATVMSGLSMDNLLGANYSTENSATLYARGYGINGSSGEVSASVTVSSTNGQEPFIQMDIGSDSYLVADPRNDNRYGAVAQSSALALTAGTGKAVCSHSFEPGTYLVTGHVFFSNNANGYRAASLHTVSGTIPDTAIGTTLCTAPANGHTTHLDFPIIWSPTSTTTLYLNALSSVALNCQGQMRWVRLL